MTTNLEIERLLAIVENLEVEDAAVADLLEEAYDDYREAETALFQCRKKVEALELKRDVVYDQLDGARWGLENAEQSLDNEEEED